MLPRPMPSPRPPPPSPMPERPRPPAPNDVADLVAPHVAAGAERIVAERVVAAPRRGRRVRIAAGAGVEQADHAELRPRRAAPPGGRCADRGCPAGPARRSACSVALVFGLPIEPSSPLARVPVPPSLLSALFSATCSVSFSSCSRSAAALQVLLDQVAADPCRCSSSSVRPSGGMKNAIAASRPTCASERQADVQSTAQSMPAAKRRARAACRR